MDRDEALRRIEALIDEFADLPTDAAFIDVLEEMVDRAQTALDARREELAARGADEDDD